MRSRLLPDLAGVFTFFRIVLSCKSSVVFNNMVSTTCVSPSVVLPVRDLFCDFRIDFVFGFSF